MHCIADGQWWLMNDELRYQVSTDEVLNKCDAYILFYVRHRPRQQYPVVPPSHVDKPPTRKRWPPLSPLEDREVGEAADIHSGPLVKRSRLHQQQLSNQPPPRRLDPVLAGPQNESQPAADSATLLSHMAAYAQDSEAYASNSMHSTANGGSCCNGSSGDQSGLSQDQARWSQQSQGSADEPSWLTAHDPHQAPGIALSHGAVANPDQAAARGPSWDPVSTPGAAQASPKPFGFSSFSLGSSRLGQAPAKPPQGSGSSKAAACLVPPNSAGDDSKAVLANEQQPLYGPGTAAGGPVSKAGLKRSRPDSEAEQELELVLDDNIQAGPNRAKGSNLASAAKSLPVDAASQSRQAPIGSLSTGLMLETDASHHNSFSFSQQQQQQAHTMHASKQQQVPAALSQQQRAKQHDSDELPSLHQRQPAHSFMARKQPSWSRPPSDLLSSDAPPHIKYAPPQARSQLLGNPSGPPAQQQLPLKGGSASRPNGHLGATSQSNGHSSQGIGALPAASLAAIGSAAGDQIARDAFPMSFGSNRKAGIAHHSWQATANPASKASAGSDTAGRTSSAAGPAKGPSQVASDASAGQSRAGALAAAQPGLLPAAQQEAAREGNGGGSGKLGSGHKSARKPGMLGRMKSTVT